MSENPFKYIEDIQNNLINQVNPAQENTTGENILEEYKKIKINPKTGKPTTTKYIITTLAADKSIKKTEIEEKLLSGDHVVQDGKEAAYKDNGDAIDEDHLIHCKKCRGPLDKRARDCHQLNPEVWLCDPCNEENDKNEFKSTCINILTFGLIGIKYYHKEE